MLQLLRSSLFQCVVLAASYSVVVGQDDWSRWRGPTGNGIAASDQRPVVQWDETTNIVWKTKVPGRGHASPIILGDRILLATSDQKEQTQSVVCFHRKSGKLLWQTVVNRGELNKQLHPNNTAASSTIATDGERAFAVFNHRDSVYVTGLSLDGEVLWEQRVGGYQPYYKFGFGASPIVFSKTVIVANHNNGDPAIVAYDTQSGQEIWKTICKVGTGYATPVVATIGGREQMLISGLQMVASYCPTDGTLLWQSPAKWDVACGTMIWDEERVYASGGFPPAQTLAIRADGSGERAWENNQKSYEQSMLLYQGFLYTHTDGGIVYCWRATDGKEMWKTRFTPGGRVPQSASPVLANEKIYITAENGETLVFEANPNEFVEVSRNKLGDEAFASMAICGNQIFARVTSLVDGDRSTRQEWLYCIGEPSSHTLSLSEN